ncbi:MAG TPA: hypothetical protein VFO29_10565 [Candidatus Rubrimentiphilum sp.]|nr:hypothetical protein [Candidatus Rubrimentiphilum sp.]
MKLFRTILASGIALSAAAALSACGGSTTTTSTSTAASEAPGEYGGASKAPAGGAMKASAGGAMMASGISVTFAPQNGSKQSGSGSVTNKSGGVWVTLTVTNEPKGASEPTHIHQGTCAKLNPAPWKVLANTVNGKSSTLVPGLTVAQLKKGPYAINLHKSLKQLSVYVSCGNL